jgi:hypothetical protein
MNTGWRACFLSRELCITVMAIMMLARALERNRRARTRANRARDRPQAFWARISKGSRFGLVETQVRRVLEVDYSDFASQAAKLSCGA